MITLYHLVDALPASFMAIMALLVGASRWHWFVRTAIAGAIVLPLLLIPAHEVLVQSAISVALVAAGMALWRRKRRRGSITDSSQPAPRAPFRPQLSLRNLLLFTVVVAVVAAVLGNAPRAGWYPWVSQFGIGAVTAVGTLFCLWIVFGQIRWPRRLIVAGVFIPLLATVFVLFQFASILIYYWMENSQSAQYYWQSRSIEVFWDSVADRTTVLSISVAIVCVWLGLMHAAGWYYPFPDVESSPAPAAVGRRRSARWAAVAVSLAIAAPPLYLFYRLLTPTPYSPDRQISPNGYDEIVAVSKMLRDSGLASNWIRSSGDDQYFAALNQHAAALNRLHAALETPCLFPLFSSDQPRNMGTVGLVNLSEFLQAANSRNLVFLETAVRLQFDLDCIKLDYAESRSEGFFGRQFTLEDAALNDLANALGDLSARECTELAAELSRLDSHREPFDRVYERMRIREQRGGWQAHLRQLLADWGGVDEKPPLWDLFRERQAKMRLLIAELAIRAYKLDNGKPPQSLTSLVPKYLPAIPVDPFDNRPLKYGSSSFGYTPYTVGYNHSDNGGSIDGSLRDDDWISTDLLRTLRREPMEAEGK